MRLSPQLRQIRSAVQYHERRLMKQAPRHGRMIGGWTSFPTNGPRGAGYGATPPERLSHFMDQAKRFLPELFDPQQHIADLGSGLGMAAFTQAEFFSRVTGLEVDARLCQTAEQIRTYFNVHNIQFINKDFLESDLRHFAVIYLFYPFIERFVDLMKEKLMETRPGTVIIARECCTTKIFSYRHYRQTYPPYFDQAFPRDQTMLDFAVYIKL